MCPDGDEPALIKHSDTVAEHLRLLKVVGGDQDGLALIAQCEDVAPDGMPRLHIPPSVGSFR